MKSSIYIYFIVLTRKTNHGRNYELAEEFDNRPLVVATLDGTLAALDKHTGVVKWRIKDRKLYTLF